ncbi:diflavin flavoprotein [Cyanobacterium sp. Dongsha4]|uniref:diflavin flavoprotein n=1 Tax=Cyanobacterium sp. DS4 TaxID=2878255 RepID=UPI002E80DB08|nr:diflavin flavoprotein [Cyanobacterium sp. Dongsha4]WVL01581.1 diflavin flavoprotein [Cyanobacterium sp. Dongsha4]
MVILLQEESQKTSHRLTIQTANIGEDSTAIRCLDWDRERFDIEFSLKNGTTYNSFIIQGEKTALIDTSHRKFESLYLETIKDLMDLSTLDYLIISHTEPDHSGLVKEILELAPNVTVIGAKVAIKFLQDMVHQPFKSQMVKSGDKLDLGNGHELEFLSAPNLHWPDTIFTYDQKIHTLFTCDAFGMHYCDDYTYDEEPDLLREDFQYYYDCLMSPNARSVLAAIKRMNSFDINLIATGHGPLLKHFLSDWVNSYQQWSEAQTKTQTYGVVFYSSEYGYSEDITRAIALGMEKTGIGVELLEYEEIDTTETREIVSQAGGIVIGMPRQNDVRSHAILSTILASAHPKQAIGLFETGGWQDEPIYPLRNKFQEIGLTEAFPPILIKETFNPTIAQWAEEAGVDLGQWLSRNENVKKMKSLDNSLDKALGRLCGGLYIITAMKGDVSSAMLASWVIQATPLGVAIAVAKDRAIESLLKVGDKFVLNVLEEDNYQGLMKHFLKRFAPGQDRFEGIKTYQSSSGSPILAEALAYMECQVESRQDCHDHWIVYSKVENGRVAHPEAKTAVHHRKVGNHY